MHEIFRNLLGTVSVAAVMVGAVAPTDSLAKQLAGAETSAVTANFRDTFFSGTTGYNGSLYIVDSVTPANNYDSHPDGKFTYSVSVAGNPKMTRRADGSYKFPAHNIIVASEDASNAAWLTNAITRSYNAATAPDGTTTADLFYPASTGVDRALYTRPTRQTMIQDWTAEWCFKASGFTRVLFQVQDNGSNLCGRWINLSNGTLESTRTGGSGVTLATSSITDLTNGWYRVRLSFRMNTNSYIQFLAQCADADNSTTATASGTNGVLVWGAHLRRTVADEQYVPTTNGARYMLPYEWDTAGNARGILLENSATNTLDHGNNFADAAWVVASSATKTGTHGSITAPDGTLTAYQVNFAASGTSAINNSQTDTAGTWTLSVFARMVSGTGSFRLRLNGTADTYSSDLALTETWTRYSLTYTSAANITTCGLSNASDATARNVLFWCAQQESGSLATSPILNVSGSQQQRGTDSISMASSLFNNSATAGTLYAKVRPLGADVEQRWLQLDDGTANEAHRLGTLSTNVPFYYVFDGGASQAALSVGSIIQGVTVRACASYKANDFAFSYQANPVQTDVSGTLPTVNALRIGSGPSAANPFHGYVEEIGHFPRDFSDSEIAAIGT